MFATILVTSLVTFPWYTGFILCAALAVFLLLKRAGQISAARARSYLHDGALVIDVRTRAEFNSGHLKEAINIPMDEIGIAVPRQAKDKNKVLLLHCQSGMRSGIAQRKLKTMGYGNVFNLGSYGRAAAIVQGK